MFAGYSPDQLALIDRLRCAARNEAALGQAAEIAAETARRLKAQGPWRRLCLNAATRWWSTIAALLFPLSNRIPALNGAAVGAGRRVLQPPALWPELREGFETASASLDDGMRRGDAFRAMADGIDALTAVKGCLTVETALQIEEVARWVDDRGADAAAVREALHRIRGGESLVETMKRGL